MKINSSVIAECRSAVTLVSVTLCSRVTFVDATTRRRSSLLSQPTSQSVDVTSGQEKKVTLKRGKMIFAVVPGATIGLKRRCTYLILKNLLIFGYLILTNSSF